ncbi:hypothetical protein Q3G72_010457 [Acer saccharum]|nr:hypothetical protein Q3G72_010457 [Acer saccharum]
MQLRRLNQNRPSWANAMQDNKSLESHNYCFIFGGGTRLCPGKELGIVKITMFLHYFVTRYRWEEVGGDKLVQFPRVEVPNGSQSFFLFDANYRTVRDNAQSTRSTPIASSKVHAAHQHTTTPADSNLAFKGYATMLAFPVNTR